MRTAILMALFLGALEGCGYQGGYVLEADGSLPDAGTRPQIGCVNSAHATCPAGWAPGCVDPATGFIARNPSNDPDGPGVCTAHGFESALACGDGGVVDVCPSFLVPGCAALYDGCPAP